MPTLRHLMVQTLVEARSHPQEVLAWVGIFCLVFVVQSPFSIGLGVMGAVAIELAEFYEEELILWAIPASALGVFLLGMAVAAASSVGCVRAISQRMDGGPRISLRSCVRLTWPRLPQIVVLNLVGVHVAYFGLLAGVLPGVVAFALYQIAIMAILVHGLRVAEALSLAVVLFLQRPWLVVGAGALTALPAVGGYLSLFTSLVEVSVAWAWATNLVGLLSIPTMLLYYHFWLLTYKALVGRGRAPIWPTRS